MEDYGLWTWTYVYSKEKKTNIFLGQNFKFVPFFYKLY